MFIVFKKQQNKSHAFKWQLWTSVFPPNNTGLLTTHNSPRSRSAL